jgi:hypothetical protein
VHDETLAWIKEILGRQSDPGYSEPFPEAVSILDEFGGLRVDVNGPGVSMKRSPFNLDPRQGLLGSGAYQRLAATSGYATFPIGVHHDQGGALAIDEKGRIFLIHPVDDMLVGRDIHDGLNNLILGVRPEPFYGF